MYVKGLNTFAVKGEAEIAAVLEVGAGPMGPSSTAVLHSLLRCGARFLG